MRYSAPLIRPEDWVPQGVDTLEPTAEEVVRGDDTVSVIAGPGAGKTELLAQKAAYLLQTGRCASPRRILAISFKKSSAKNLEERIKQRCNQEQSSRFDSMTFDAFAKGILDRFRAALPTEWRPSPDYAILLPSRSTWNEFLNGLHNLPLQFGGKQALDRINRDHFAKWVTAFELPATFLSSNNINQWSIIEWWLQALNPQQGHLSFPMIQRLIVLLFKTNPKLIMALRITYSHVFLDEFQDISEPQYQLVKTIFQNSDTRMTAVGDYKQKIMAWAGAMPNAFEQFDADYSATRKILLFNYRSVPELVRVQHNLSLAIDFSTTPAQSQRRIGPNNVQVCAVWEFVSPQNEAFHLINFIRNGFISGLSPRNFVLLVRQKADDAENMLRPYFAASGINFRNEARSIDGVSIQDLLAEPLVELVLGFLQLGAVKRGGPQWRHCHDLLLLLRSVDPDDDKENRRLQDELGRFQMSLYNQMKTLPANLEEAKILIHFVLNFAPEKALISAVPQYCQGDWYVNVRNACCTLLLESCRNAGSWANVFERFLGVNDVPLMTIHKSKGLEFHTVLFVGLDDSAFWNMHNDRDEGLLAFFVAFSRARDRAFFTYCHQRGNRQKVKEIYAILASAGVPTICQNQVQGDH
ncbi:MAG: ATP-dependent helicase [Magnetococcales bacterium]|nr:ATP-dependent helicase [Magnetococcales bacterium]